MYQHYVPSPNYDKAVSAYHGPPSYPPAPPRASDLSTTFTAKKVVILFLHLINLLILLGINWVAARDEAVAAVWNAKNQWYTPFEWKWVVRMFALVVPTVSILSCLLLQLMYAAPRVMIHAGFLTNALSSVALAVFGAYLGKRGWGFMGLEISLYCYAAIWFLMGLYSYIYYRKRIRLSAFILRATADVAQSNGAMVLVTILLGAVYAFYLVGLILMLVLTNFDYVSHVFAGLNRLIELKLVGSWTSGYFLDAVTRSFAFSNDVKVQWPAPSIVASAKWRWLIALYAYFALVWVAGSIQTIAWAFISGVYHSRHVSVDSDGRRRRTRSDVSTFACLRRALSYSLGRSCLSVVVANFVEGMRRSFVVSKSRDNSSSRISNEDRSMSKRLISKFNYYAYSHISAYGKSFSEAAKDSHELVASSGLEPFVYDNALLYSINYWTGAMAIATGAIAFAITDQVLSPLGTLVYTFASFILGAVVASTFFLIIYAGPHVLLVCLAEDPEAFRRLHPELYDYLAPQCHLHLPRP